MKSINNQDYPIEPLHIYGDESTYKEIVVYGTVLVQPDLEEMVCKRIIAIKNKYNVPHGSEVHCRILFNGDQRKKSTWSNHTMDDIFSLFDDLQSTMFLHNVKTCVCKVNRSRLPLKMEANGIFGETPLEEKQLAGWAFQGVVGAIVKELGHENVKLWTDPDKTKIKWMGTKRRADRNYQVFVAKGSEIFSVKREEVIEGKGLLLELADIVAFTASHVKSSHSYRYKKELQQLYSKFVTCDLEFEYDPGLSNPVSKDKNSED